MLQSVPALKIAVEIAWRCEGHGFNVQIKYNVSILIQVNSLAVECGACRVVVEI